MVLSFTDVAGLSYQKKSLYNALILPEKKQALYNKLVKDPTKLRLRNNFLFYGPPGTGKTFLAQALASELKKEYVVAQATQFLNQYVGKGAQTIRSLYNQTNGIIFIDEIDAIATSRDSHASRSTQDVLMQLLLVLDSVNTSQVCATIFATNKKECLDDALLSRIPKINQLYFSLPDYSQRKNILELKLSYFNHDISDMSLLAKQTEKYDGRALEDLVINASHIALEQDSFIIKKEHIYKALEVISNEKK
jgi:ATP-dependent 26S proteasome regulatory subunit